MTYLEKKQKRKFNILFVSSHFNYFVNNNADFLLMYNTINFFHNNNQFNVYILQPSLEKKLEDKKLKGHIKCFYFKPLYFLKNHFHQFNDFNPFYYTKIRKIIKKFNIDLIHIEYHHGINVLRLIKDILVSYNAHNMEYLFADRMLKYYYKYPKFSRYFLVKYHYFLEKYAVNFVKHINTVTLKDKKDFIRIYNTPKEKFIVNSYGYDKAIFNNPIKKAIAREKLGIEKNQFVVIFHGSYLHKGNEQGFNLIINKIAPKVINENILFLIAGKNIPFFKVHNNVKILGYVDDLRYFLYAADIALVPLMSGGGIKTKMVDYLSALIPVISTKIGAEGLHLKNNVHGYIVEDPIKDSIKILLELKNNPEKVAKFKENIRKLLKEEFDWDIILTRLSKRYKEIILNK